VLILARAVLPMVAAPWWESPLNKPLVSAVVSLPVVVASLRAEPHALAEAGAEYASFVILIGALCS
jgi:hypothetical protein